MSNCSRGTRFGTQGFRAAKALAVVCLGAICLGVRGQGTLPIVAIHDSELTRALETMPATGGTPSGSGTTGNQWWPPDWHYFVMPEAMKEAFRSDGTAFTVVGDSNITANVLLTNGTPKYPIVISLTSEAIRNDEIAQFTNYVAAGGFLFVGASAFTRNTNGTSRGDFAFGNEMGIHMATATFTNWMQNNYFTKQLDHRLISHVPSGQLTWRLPSSSDEINWGVSPSHPFNAPHDLWRVNASDATVLASGDTNPYLTIKPFGKGYFIYCAAFQPLIGHGGFGPGMYTYVMFRRAVEWAFESAGVPVPKLSPWPFQYDAAIMIRHDLEDFTNEIANVELSAAYEKTNNAHGDYYFCTGTLRDDASSGGYNTNSMVASLRRAVTNYGATIGPHNGGLKNPGNSALNRGDYDYWHWGPDEVLDLSPSGYANGKAYAQASIGAAFSDIESWLAGIGPGLRTWVACNFNATREDSYDLQSQLNIKIIGDQKISPFPHWTLSTRTPGKRYAMLSEPVSDWFVNGMVAQSLENWHPPGVHTAATEEAAIDFYYNLGALINIYSHAMSTGLEYTNSGSGVLVQHYIAYGMNNTNLHPRLWSTNGIGIYQWWLQRSNAQIAVSFSTNGYQSLATVAISGSQNANTAIEVLLPGTNTYCGVQVLTNGAMATGNSYRLNGQVVKVLVGTTVTNVVVGYYSMSVVSTIFSENFDSTTPPGLPTGWSTSATGAQSAWITQNGTNDSAPRAVFSTDATNSGVNQLVSPAINMPSGQAQLSFRNYYDLETGSGGDGFDGGVLEIKIGAGPFMDIISAGGNFVSGGYASVIDSNYGNPLAGRQAWSGTSPGFISTVVNLPTSAAGQTIQLQWRCGTDNGNGRTGWRIDTVAITSQGCMCCSSTNHPPVLPAQSNRTVAEFFNLVVTNTATDPDVPPQSLGYSLVNPPAGAAIDGNGVITWTPTEIFGASTNAFTTIVTDSGFPPLSATNTFNVIVTESNTPPILPVQPNRTINEGVTLTVTNNATDNDYPINTLSYNLAAAPAGATISGSGVITWATTEATGPSTNTFTTIVTDSNPWAFNSQHLSATNTFTVVVNEINLPPVLPAQANRTIAPNTLLVVTNTATDPDQPPNALTYSLANPPAGMTIDPNGVISWTPTPAQDVTTNLITTIVTDYNPWAVNSQHLSATNTFTVVVNDRPLIVPVSATLALEGCAPANSAIDPGESVTVLFAFKNTGLGDTTNLVVTLLATNGVVSPGSPQTYGVVAAGGATVSQAFTFGAVGVCGGTITATLQLQDGGTSLGIATFPFALGATNTIFSESFDSVTAPALPGGWTTSASGYESNWVTQTAVRDTAPNAAFVNDGVNIGLSDLLSPTNTLPVGSAQLSFRHTFSFEADTLNATNGYDGGVLEIKLGNGPFTDILTAGGSFVTNGYNRTISTNFGCPIAGRQAWSGTNGGFVTTIVNLPVSNIVQTYQLRFRAGSDNGNGGGGWRIDTIAVTGSACCQAVPPVLPAQANRTIAELASLFVTNTAITGSSLSYTLLNPPLGAVIDGNGVINWTPSEAQGPSTNSITTVVSDGSTPPLSATNSFNVVVTEVNSAPVLPAQSNRTIAGLATLLVTNTATDSDIPANSLTYQLLVAPVGAAIDAGGVITWTPVPAQVPSTNTFSTVVTDFNPWAASNQHLSATNTFAVVVSAIHNGPSLPAQSNRTVNELTALVVTNTATDSDLPTMSLTYSLLSAPVGVQISPNGIITWTPSEAQGPSTNAITTIVSDNGSPVMSATNSFTVFVQEVNSAPVLPAQTNRTIQGLGSLVVTNTATDSDIPANTLTYQLLNPPAGALIDTNGIIYWTPSAGQVPGTNVFTTVVTDYNPWAVNQQQLSATNAFTVVVLSSHTGPSLPVQTNRAVNELTLLLVTNTASDSDFPAWTLTYGLVNPPDGASVDPNGVISWIPTEAQGPGSYLITTVVSDNATPSLSVTNAFTVQVNEVNTAPVLPTQANRTIAGLTPLVVTNTATDSDLPVNTLTYSLLSQPPNAVIDTNGIIAWTPTRSQVPGTYTFTTVVTDFNPDAVNDARLSATNTFNVVVQIVHHGPKLPAQSNFQMTASTRLVVCDTASDADIPPPTILSYALLQAPAGATIDTNGIISWLPVAGQAPTTNLFQITVSDDLVPPMSATNSFSVIVQPPQTSTPPVIQSLNVSGDLATLTWTSVTGRTYRVLYSDDLTATSWSAVVPDVSATDAVSSITNSVADVALRYYRVLLLP